MVVLAVERVQVMIVPGIVAVVVARVEHGRSSSVTRVANRCMKAGSPGCAREAGRDEPGSLNQGRAEVWGEFEFRWRFRRANVNRLYAVLAQSSG
jgi:hypothetical protein